LGGGGGRWMVGVGVVGGWGGVVGWGGDVGGRWVVAISGGRAARARSDRSQRIAGCWWVEARGVAC